MIFDNLDAAYLKLCGLCRYLPADLQRRYDSPIVSRAVIANLEEHKLIKRQSNNLSFKLTWAGRELRAGMGDTFPVDARMDLKRPAYRRKLKNAEWNVLLFLAGIDVFGESVRQLNDSETGYVSSLMLRADTNVRVLAGTPFLGILKIRKTAYIPYYADGCVIPGFEREIFQSQLESLNGITDIKLICTFETLEELWARTHPEQRSEPGMRGLREMDRSLEELGYECLLVPFGRGGAMQMNLVKLRRYRERIAQALGCDTTPRDGLSECDGMLGGIPCVTAIDLNAERIVRALKQIYLYDNKAVPKICCLPFQKPVMFRLLRHYGCQKSAVITINEEQIYRIFPELYADIVRAPYRTKEGECIAVSTHDARAADEAAPKKRQGV